MPTSSVARDAERKPERIRYHGGVRRLGLAALGLVACTVSNPEFGLDGSGSDGGSGGASSGESGGSTTRAAADTGESTGAPACGFADVPEFELRLEQDGTEIPAMCGAQSHLITVLGTAADALVYQSCDQTCPCAEGPMYRLVFDNLVLPAITVPDDGCMHMVIERSDACEVTGFVLSLPPGLDETPEFVVVQQIDRGPEGTARPLPSFDYELTETCDCSNCCASTGIYRLVIAGEKIAEGETKPVPEPAFGPRAMLVHNLASHVDETCTPTKLWTATKQVD